MTHVYDNWERLVRATLDREQLRQIALRTPSDLSIVSASSSFNFTSHFHSASSFNLSSLLVEVNSAHRQILETSDYLSSSNLIEDGPSGALAPAVAQPLVKDLAAAIQEQGQYAIQFRTQFRELEEQLKYMQSFVVDSSQIKHKRETLKTTLAVLQELIYEVDDLVVDCQIREDHRKMRGSSSFPLSFSEMSFRYEMGRKLTEINSQIRRMRANLNSYYIPIAEYPNLEKDSDKNIRWTLPVFDESEVVGLTEDVAIISSWILSHIEPLLLIAIVGLPGLGKTTIAEIIYREVYITKRFQEKIWISVSQTVNEVEIMKSMLWQLRAYDVGSSKGDEMLNRINRLLSDKTYLIVLDNVWSTDDGWWERISSALPKREGTNSCIIITSRNREVVNRMGAAEKRVHQPKLLDDEDSWALFCKVAQLSTSGEENPTNLFEIGKEIVQKCGGLPLAIKTVGRLLSLADNTTSEWMRICHNFHEKLTTIELNNSVGNDSVLASLKLTYDELPAHLKQCLLCFSVYPEDYEIDVGRLIYWWVGEGFVRGKSKETATESAFSCLSELINRCLLEVSQQRNFDGRVYTCKMHDMVRHLTIKIAEEENFCSFNVSGKHIETPRRLGVTEETSFQALRRNSKLRALLLITADYIVFNRNVELAKVKSLRVLDLSHVKLDYVFVKDLWHWITSLNRLAFLNLGYVKKLIRVPNTIDKLWGLQILILRGCERLEKLPTSISNLPRLTILDISYCPCLRYLPHGLSRLSNLQELYGFKVAGPTKATASHLGELKALTELRVLQMNITEESAIQDEELTVLERLQKLRVLSVDAGDCLDRDILRKLDKLSPPPSIEELYLKHYFGETTPGWINPNLLPRLQYLCIEDSRINKMGNEFWGNAWNKWNVKGLCLKFCQRLHLSWEELQAVMPNIRYLEVSQCNSLVSFPCDVKAVGFWVQEQNSTR